MRKPFEELDYQETPLGRLALRRRIVSELDDMEVFEVKLGDDFLMSSLFHEVEEALADLGLAELGGDNLEVAVGGLGLGYTAVAALRNPAVGSLVVIDFLQPVIHWHQQGLVPLGSVLNADPRCRFIQGDFFELALSTDGFDCHAPHRRFNAVLLDIDHSPNNLLHPRHESFYSSEGLAKMAAHLLPGGVFALWSDDPPDEQFIARLGTVFKRTRAEVVTFFNPLLEKQSASTIYVSVL